MCYKCSRQIRKINFKFKLYQGNCTYLRTKSTRRLIPTYCLKNQPSSKEHQVRRTSNRKQKHVLRDEEKVTASITDDRHVTVSTRCIDTRVAEPALVHALHMFNAGSSHFPLSVLQHPQVERGRRVNIGRTGF